jgi:hypothetical protein
MAVPWAIASAAVLIATALIGFALLKRRPAATIATIALGWLLATQVLISGTQVLSPVYSTRYLVDQLRDVNTRGAPFYSVNYYAQSLPFYLERKVIPVNYKGELAFGIERRDKASRYVASLAAFKHRWRAEPRAFAFMSRGLYHLLRHSGLAMRVVARDPRRVIVEKGSS